eukprot:442633-Rhodomonas_salina.1
MRARESKSVCAQQSLAFNEEKKTPAICTLQPITSRYCCPRTSSALLCRSSNLLDDLDDVLVLELVVLSAALHGARIVSLAAEKKKKKRRHNPITHHTSHITQHTHTTATRTDLGRVLGAGAPHQRVLELLHQRLRHAESGARKPHSCDKACVECVCFSLWFRMIVSALLFGLAAYRAAQIGIRKHLSTGPAAYSKGMQRKGTYTPKSNTRKRVPGPSCTSWSKLY